MRARLALAGLFSALGAAIGYGALSLVEAPGPLDRAVTVSVPRGGLDRVAEALRDAGVIGSVPLFKAAATLTAWQGRLHSAELVFPRQSSLAGGLVVLRMARPVQHKLTIAEGLTAARIGMLVSRADGLAGEIDLPEEGEVLPQTYLYERGDSVRSVLQRAEGAMRRAIDQAWASRAADAGLRSRQELLIMASLVERETHLPVERALVARVFYNRLAHGMRLQTDPTVVYGQSGGDEDLGRGLTRGDLERDTPYNTYVRAGLPPGPICSPGIASINAAAHPAQSAALYFVADGTGGHSFADSLDEHVRNVRRYRLLGR